MSASPILTLLDVGHGSCAILSDGEVTSVVDAGPGSALLEYLSAKNISKIHTLIISHADADHISGLIALLSSDLYSITHVLINADSIKKSALWEDVRHSLDTHHDAGTITVRPVLSGKVAEWPGTTTAIEVIAPSVHAVLSGGPGSTDPQGRTRTSNSSSVVLRILCNNRPIALLGGDMDDITLDELMSKKRDMRAEFLVFPHHGGHAGSKGLDVFAENVISAVEPHSILFSNGRGRYGTPRPEIVEAAHSKGVVRIACTQLSKNCCEQEHALSVDHLSADYSAGASDRKCCAGTMSIDLISSEMISPVTEKHDAFVKSLPTPICIRKTH